MQYVLRLSFLTEDDMTGKVERNYSADINVHASDGCSQGYLKEVFQQALKSAQNIVDDFKEEKT